MDTGTKIEESPLFICGTIRSGTTLLMSLLDGHPQLVVNFGESHYFDQLLPAFRRAHTADFFTLAEAILLEPWQPDNVYYKKFLAHVSCTEVKESFRSRLARINGRTKYSDYLTAAILAYGEASGQLNRQTRYWVEKTPYNEQFAYLIFTWWPGARCIHMVRDPRDFLATLKDRALKRERTLPRLSSVAHSWQQSVSLLRHNQQRYGSDRYLCIRYEDLARFPEREMAQITDFLGIGKHGTLFMPTKGGGRVSWNGNAVDKDFSGISSENVGRWKNELPYDEVALLETLLSRDMKQLGYDSEFPSSLSASVRNAPIRIINLLRFFPRRIGQANMINRYARWQ